MTQLDDSSDLTRTTASERPIRHLRSWATIEMRMETGQLFVRGTLGGDQARRVRCVLRQRENVFHEERFAPQDFEAGVSFRDIPVRLWWPAATGEQVLYDLTVELLGADDAVLDVAERRVGFKHGALGGEDDGPAASTPDACEINGREIQLSAADWAPLATQDQDPVPACRRALLGHREAGMNLLRVAIEETPAFYALCDELGLLVWQTIPVAAAGGGAETGAIARDCVSRLQHHPSLLAWAAAPGTTPDGLAALSAIVDELDPTRRLQPA